MSSFLAIPRLASSDNEHLPCFDEGCRRRLAYSTESNANSQTLCTVRHAIIYETNLVYSTLHISQHEVICDAF